MVFILLFLIYLSTVTSKCIHVAANCIILFFFMIEQYCILCMYIYIYIYIYTLYPFIYIYMYIHTHTSSPYSHPLICTHTHLYIFSILSSVNRYLGFIHALAIINSAINIRVHVYFQIIVLSRYMPRSGIVGSHGNSVFLNSSFKIYSTNIC